MKIIEKLAVQNMQPIMKTLNDEYKKLLNTSLEYLYYSAVKNWISYIICSDTETSRWQAYRHVNFSNATLGKSKKFKRCLTCYHLHFSCAVDENSVESFFILHRIPSREKYSYRILTSNLSRFTDEKHLAFLRYNCKLYFFKEENNLLHPNIYYT